MVSNAAWKRPKAFEEGPDLTRTASPRKLAAPGVRPVRQPSKKGEITMQARTIAATVLGLTLGFGASAQDATKVDAKHYKVEFENDAVRILHIKYGPGEKSVMHEHPDAVAVFLTPGKVRFTMADGKTVEADVKAGTAQWTPAAKHLPENLGKKPFEVMLVEMKGKAAAPK